MSQKWSILYGRAVIWYVQPSCTPHGFQVMHKVEEEQREKEVEQNRNFTLISSL